MVSSAFAIEYFDYISSLLHLQAVGYIVPYCLTEMNIRKFMRVLLQLIAILQRMPMNKACADRVGAVQYLWTLGGL
jgi:hypothetical protein